MRKYFVFLKNLKVADYRAYLFKDSYRRKTHGSLAVSLAANLEHFARTRNYLRLFMFNASNSTRQ